MVSRRDVLKMGAVVGGALVAAPLLKEEDVTIGVDVAKGDDKTVFLIDDYDGFTKVWRTDNFLSTDYPVEWYEVSHEEMVQFLKSSDRHMEDQQTLFYLTKEVRSNHVQFDPSEQS